MLDLHDTIVAIATPPGLGAIGVIRLSGMQALVIAQKIFSGKNLAAQATHTLHFGKIKDGANVIDEAVAGIFKGPGSYTGDDVVELSCHGSDYVLQQVLALCLTNGARMAKPGEFTLRAFLNGKLDLAQAEAVADLIASQGGAAHKAAIHNLRGGFSSDLRHMREQLIQFSALIELELDFSQEDVEFADRTRFYQLIEQLTLATDQLIRSFRLGNVIRNGVSVAIVGAPNAGKSTLLNALLNEERAIVSDIAGTTRDTIAETLNINGILFRLIDTAGIRHHSIDAIEQQGIARSRAAIEQADIVVYVFDVLQNINPVIDGKEVISQSPFEEIRQAGTVKYLLVGNKADAATDADIQDARQQWGNDAIFISARNKENIQQLKTRLYSLVAEGEINLEGTIVTNARHYNALERTLSSLHDIKTGLDNNIPGDLIAPDIRTCLLALGEITGQVTTEDKLDYIFSKFCIGK